MTKKIITYVKHEGANLNGMIATSKLVVNCEALNVIESFLGTCSIHAFFKACQHSTYHERMSKDLKYVSIKLVQANLQKIVLPSLKNRKKVNMNR